MSTSGEFNFDDHTTLYEPDRDTPIPGEPPRFQPRAMSDRQLLEALWSAQQEMGKTLAQQHLLTAEATASSRATAQAMVALERRLEARMGEVVADVKELRRQRSGDYAKVEARAEKIGEQVKEQLLERIEGLSEDVTELAAKVKAHSLGVQELKRDELARAATKRGFTLAVVGAGTLAGVLAKVMGLYDAVKEWLGWK